MTDAQTWLTDNYENQKNTITEIRIGKDSEGKVVELEEKLVIADYTKLKKIFLGGVIGGVKGIIELKISNCPAIELLFVSNNQLTKIDGLEDLPDLQKLSIAGNKIEKIDLSKNKKLAMLNFRNNPTGLEVNGLNELTSLVEWDSYKTFPITKIFDQVSEKELKEIAKELGLPVEGKSLEDIKKDIKDELEKNKQNKEKLNDEFPGLFDGDGKVDGNKAKEIKDKVNDYNELAKNNPKLVDNDGKIDLGKVKDASDKSEKFGELENTMKEAGIDPSNAAEAKKEIQKLNALKERVMELFGKDYEERLEVKEFQTNIEINTINN